MDTKIKDTVILCPECGAPGLFTCTNCKHQIRFSMQWERAKEEPEDRSDRLKKKEPEKESSGPAVDKAAEGPAKEVKDKDIPEEQSKEKKDRESKETTARLKQALIDEIKVSLQEDIKNAITEAADMIRRDLIDELKNKKESNHKSDKLKKKEPEKESSGPAVDKAAEGPAKEDRDSTAGEVKKKQTKKSDTPSGDVQEEQSKEKEDETWNKSVYII